MNLKLAPTWFLVAAIASAMECASSSGRSENVPPITRKLLSKEPVCLALEWDPDAHPIYYGKPAPDTLVLFPELHRRAPVDSADAWGLIQLAPSQRDRNGGGWWWWIAKGGLQISTVGAVVLASSVIRVRRMS